MSGWRGSVRQCLGVLALLALQTTLAVWAQPGPAADQLPLTGTLEKLMLEMQ